MSTSKPQLILVYNAESGIVNALIHAVHKQVKPETYPCSLCALTYGTVSMHTRWREFLDGLPLEIVIHHSDDFAVASPDVQIALPAILTRDFDKAPEMLIGAEQLDAMIDLDELIATTKLALSKRRQNMAA